MKAGLVEMVFILDRSGSMSGLVDDTIGGFNSLIEKQKSEPGEAYVTTVLFDDKYEVLHDHINIKDVNPITNKEYYPRGCTALLDAVGATINMVGKRLSDTPEEERPCQVIFTITTDGYENSSHEFTKQKVKEMVEHQQSKYSWIFMFLGANIDAFSEGGAMGMSHNMTRGYNATQKGVSSVYAAVSNAISIGRSYSMGSSSSNTSGDANSSSDYLNRSVSAYSKSYSQSYSMNEKDKAEMQREMSSALDDIF